METRVRGVQREEVHELAGTRQLIGSKRPTAGGKKGNVAS